MSALSIAVPVVALLCGIPASVAHAAEPPYFVLHSFQGVESNPLASLISDGRGNLYGTTAHGGAPNGGAIFKLRTDGTGFQRLHTFTGGASDGFDPEASLVLDGAGNLYGATAAGGTANLVAVFIITEDGGAFV